MRLGFTSNGEIASLYDKNFYIRELYYLIWESITMPLEGSSR
ncbi:hypothetical protein [Sulfuracidifex tepidarius]|nr:hypothetical protein [Sulfuracidifex tepidarius]